MCGEETECGLLLGNKRQSFTPKPVVKMEACWVPFGTAAWLANLVLCAMAGVLIQLGVSMECSFSLSH